MKLVQATNYVLKNARYMKDAPDNAKYFVKYPTPYGSTMLYSGDTNDLVKIVFAFGRTNAG